jgi:eukaryotic-like serine/threonine-protein kinase
MRHPARGAASFGLVVAIAAIALIVGAGRAHRGAGVPPDVDSHAGLEAVQLGQAAAHDYNPFGTGPENRDLIGNVVDGDPNTTWSTEQYYGGTLRKPGGVGLGIYLDAAPGVLARALEVQTPTPGFSAQVYVSDHVDLELPYGSSTSLRARGWRGPVGASTDVRSGEHIALSPGSQPYRYYLVWLTTLPPNMQSATINELTLFK